MLKLFTLILTLSFTMPPLLFVAALAKGAQHERDLSARPAASLARHAPLSGNGRPQRLASRLLL